MVKDKGLYGELPLAPSQVLVMLDQFLDRENVVGGGAQDHVPLRPALKLQQQHQIRCPVDRAGAPHHVRIAPPQTFIDEFRGQPFERRVLNLPIPCRNLPADQQLDHPRDPVRFLRALMAEGIRATPGSSVGDLTGYVDDRMEAMTSWRTDLEAPKRGQEVIERADGLKLVWLTPVVTTIATPEEQGRKPDTLGRFRSL